MEDSSEDLPKPPRRTAARPFFAPRPNSGEGVSGPFELSRRRAVQLFTPPGSSPATSPVNTAAASDAESMPTPAAAAASDAASDARELADDDRLVLEQYEPKEIELTAATPGDTDEHSIEVIAYLDANSLLKATAGDGETPQVDGLRIEATEVSFEQAPPPHHTDADDFWASDPFARMAQPASKGTAASQADETESKIDEDTAGEPGIDPAPAGDSAPAGAGIAPPWMNRHTPVSSHALEELKESEPWDLTPSHGLELIPEQPWDPTPSHGAELVPEEPAASAPTVESSAAAATSSDQRVADALVRIATRVRCGELAVPAEADMSDEATLSAVLTALLRTRR